MFQTRALFQAKLYLVYLDNFVAKLELQLLHFFKPGVHSCVAFNYNMR